MNRMSRRLLLDFFASVVEDFEGASATKFLFDVANEAHFDLVVGLDGES